MPDHLVVSLHISCFMTFQSCLLFDCVLIVPIIIDHLYLLRTRLLFPSWHVDLCCSRPPIHSLFTTATHLILTVYTWCLIQWLPVLWLPLVYDTSMAKIALHSLNHSLIMILGLITLSHTQLIHLSKLFHAPHLCIHLLLRHYYFCNSDSSHTYVTTCPSSTWYTSPPCVTQASSITFILFLPTTISIPWDTPSTSILMRNPMFYTMPACTSSPAISSSSASFL